MAEYEDTQNARFWSKVRKGEPHECWEWTASFRSTGYGQISWGGRRNEGAHRASYQIANGPIPSGAYVLHHCDNRRCVNPYHLYVGTHADNMADLKARGGPRSNGLFGEAVGTAILTEAQVVAILTDSRTDTAIALSYEVDRSTVGYIKTGRLWARVRPELPRRIVKAKITEVQKEAVRSLRSAGGSFREIAETIGISITAAHKIASS